MKTTSYPSYDQTVSRRTKGPITVINCKYFQCKCEADRRNRGSFGMPDLFKKTKDKQKAREEKAKQDERDANREYIRKESEAMLARGIIGK